MAKKRKTLAPGMVYVYYDKKTGELLSITNEVSKVYEDAIEVPYADVTSLLDTTHHFKDYIVAYRQQPDGTEKLVVETKKSNRTSINDSDYVFKNKIFEWVEESSNEVDLTITWCNTLSSWKFSLSDIFKKTHNTVLPRNLVFFITLKNDLDFLIRTISIDCEELMQYDVFVDFESNFEKDIETISIASKVVFKDYKLVKEYE